jgi:hypothetical protein
MGLFCPFLIDLIDKKHVNPIGFVLTLRSPSLLAFGFPPRIWNLISRSYGPFQPYLF